jgi:hypothetical protein
MIHIIFGLFFISLGIWGIFDEWYYVVDFLKGFSAVVLLIGGTLAILFGVLAPPTGNDNRGIGDMKTNLEASKNGS